MTVSDRMDVMLAGSVLRPIFAGALRGSNVAHEPIIASNAVELG
jgi:hypothetical protein